MSVSRRPGGAYARPKNGGEGQDDSAADEVSDLIVRVAGRDRDAFDELYSRTSAKLFSVALRILRDRAEAEEALQETYLKVWNSADRFVVSPRRAMSWMIAVARNHSIDRLRARRSSESIDDCATEYEAALQLYDASQTPEQAAIVGSEQQRIEKGLASLDPKHAALVRGAYLEGKSYKDLARENDAPVNTVRTWLRRSLRRLREHLDE